MPEGHLKKLHMATSLEALNQRVTVETNAHPKMLIKSAEAILNKAESSDKSRDEELAYVYFMRYFSIIKAIQIHDEYKKSKKYYDSILGSKKVSEIIQKAENLSKSLHRRYNLLANAKSVEKSEEENRLKEIEKQKEKESKKKVVASLPKAPAIEDGFIACEKLYSLTKEKVSSFLVLDVRPKEDFSNSVMKISSLINIPEELLRPGLTANKAGRELEENSRLLWNRRHSFDYIIICDASTDKPPLSAPINVLIDAMENWDPGKKYRASPLVLKGGFEMFALMYPILVNSKTDYISKMTLNSSHSSSLSQINDNLFNFDFPDLDMGFLSTPSPDRRVEYPPLNEGVSRPFVARSQKPKAFAGHTHPFKSDSDSFSSNNGLNSQPLLFHPPSNLASSGLTSTDSSSTASPEQDFSSGLAKTFSTMKMEVLPPTLPSRALKPPDLMASLKARQKDFEAEQTMLEHTFRAEKDTLEKLEEVEATQKGRDAARDEATHRKLSIQESRLRDELRQRKNYTQDVERKYALLHQQNADMRTLLSQLFSGQVKIENPSAQPYGSSNNQKEESDAMRAYEEKRKALLGEVEEMRRKRKEKERDMKEEEERKIEREREEERRRREREREREREIEEERKKQEMEEAKEELRWAAERNSRNREQFPPESQNASSSKRIGETYTAKLRSSPRSSPVRGGTNIKRSHSALNLSQLRDDSSFDSPSSAMPSFDRTMKPLDSPRRRNVNAARQRNFEPKYGSVGPTKTGLKNLGNTCYMNSIIQCLSNTFPLAKYFHEGHYSEDINPKSNQKGDIAEEVGAVVRAMWCGQYRSIAIWDLKSVVGRYHKAFQGYDQHDSHEFLIKLMDWLHEDLNLVTERHLKMEEQNFENTPDYVAAQSVMDALQERDESMVRGLFHGLQRSVIVCHTCNHRSLTFEPFSILTLSFPPSGRCTLKDMLYEYYKETRLDYTCSKCQRMRSCTMKFDIWKLPPVLIIHLSRFEHDVLMKKKQNFVDFPLENLCMSEHTAGVNRLNSYDLYGVSNHYGTIDGGHYTAFCKSPHKSWYKFDDHEVYDLPRESVRTSAAYILFYEATHQKSSL